MGATISSCVDSGPAYALLQAVRQGDLREIQFRVDRDPDLLSYRSLGSRETVWHLAAAGGNEEVLGALEAHCGLLTPMLWPEVLNSRNDRGQTPLMASAQAGHATAVQWLLARGADPWVQDRCGGRTALHYAVMKGRLECIKVLLASRDGTQELRRYIEVRSISGLTPLHYAVASRQVEAVGLLLERGADMRAVNTIGDAYDLVNVPLRSTPLHVAALMDSLPCALELLQYYQYHLAGPNFPDPRRRVDALGRTPYRVAVARGSRGLLSELLHPSSYLEGIFAREGGPVGQDGVAGAAGRKVPRLAVLAAAVVRQQLVADVEQAERAILDFRRRFPMCCVPDASWDQDQAQAQPALSPSPASGAATVPTPSDATPPDPSPQRSYMSPDTGGDQRSRRSSRRGSRDRPLMPPLRITLPAAGILSSSFTAAPAAAAAAAAAAQSVQTLLHPDQRPAAATRRCSREAGPCCGSAPAGTSPPDSSTCTPRKSSLRAASSQTPAPDPDTAMLAEHHTAAAAAGPYPDPNPNPNAATDTDPDPDAPCRPRCPQPPLLSPFLRRSAGYVENAFSRSPLVPLAQCAVCLEEGWSLVCEPCRHRLCGHCARHVAMAGPADLPVGCPVCRLALCQFSSPV